jgi:hypothetical protein
VVADPVAARLAVPNKLPDPIHVQTKVPTNK